MENRNNKADAEITFLFAENLLQRDRIYLEREREREREREFCENHIDL